MSRTVTISLVPLEADAVGRRVLQLSPGRSRVPIGRASQVESKHLKPELTNAWFDNRVLSRSHAEIHLVATTKDVCIVDTNSMHGTWVNDNKLVPGHETPLKPNDVLTFGAAVNRGPEHHEPVKVRYSVVWESQQPKESTPIKRKVANTFVVPDDDDDDDVVEVQYGPQDEAARPVESERVVGGIKEKPENLSGSSKVITVEDDDNDGKEGDKLSDDSHLFDEDSDQDKDDSSMNDASDHEDSISDLSSIKSDSIHSPEISVADKLSSPPTSSPHVEDSWPEPDLYKRTTCSSDPSLSSLSDDDNDDEDHGKEEKLAVEKESEEHGESMKTACNGHDDDDMRALEKRQEDQKRVQDLIAQNRLRLEQYHQKASEEPQQGQQLKEHPFQGFGAAQTSMSYKSPYHQPLLTNATATPESVSFAPQQSQPPCLFSPARCVSRTQAVLESSCSRPIPRYPAPAPPYSQGPFASGAGATPWPAQSSPEPISNVQNVPRYTTMYMDGQENPAYGHASEPENISCPPPAGGYSSEPFTHDDVHRREWLAARLDRMIERVNKTARDNNAVHYKDQSKPGPLSVSRSDPRTIIQEQGESNNALKRKHDDLVDSSSPSNVKGEAESVSPGPEKDTESPISHSLGDNLAPLQTEKEIALPSPSPTEHDEKEKTEEPPRKKARIATRVPRRRPSKSRYAATALAGAVVGGVGAVLALASLPVGYFD